MASMGESSLGSLQIAQLKEQILQGRVPPEANTNTMHAGRDGEATKSTDTNDGSNEINDDGGITTNTSEGDGEGSNVNGEIVIEESANAYRTPVSSPKASKADGLKVPRLESAKAAPSAEMEGMVVNQTPSQEAFEEMTRASSFSVFEDGDTQAMDSQVYQDWEREKSIALEKSTNAQTPKKEKTLLQISPSGRVDYDTYNTNATGAPPRTLQEGDKGFVDLAAYRPDPQSPTVGSVSDAGDLLEDVTPEEQLPVPEDVFRKPAMPETPTLAGHKRRRTGEMITSDTPAAKTPGFTQAFGFRQQNGDMMTGTQLFEQTQARSSPMVDGPRSDPALTRPSPNIQNNLTVSSPPMMMSSPIHTRAPPPTAGEPREIYTRVRESQERKKRAKLEQDFGLKGPENHDLDNDDDSYEDAAQRRFSNKRLRRTVSEDAIQTLKQIHVHSRPPSRPATSSSPHKTTTIDLRTPGTVKKGGDVDFEVSDDGEPDDEPMEGDEPIVEDDLAEAAADDDLQSVNDVYDELGQTVLRSQGLEPDDEDGNDEDAQEEELDDELPAEVGEEVEQDAPQRTLVQGSSQQDRNHLQRRSQTATQHSAIADSQPLRIREQQGAAPRGGIDGSPSCSYVPGSQYARKTSQEQVLLPTGRAEVTMGPPANATSRSQDTAQQVVPSSPPLAATHSTTADYTAAASLERRPILDQFQGAQKGTEQLTEEPEIPESDVAAIDHASSRPATAEDRPNTESNNVPFSTARSHLLASGPSLSQGLPPPSPIQKFASQQSKVSSQSPRAKAGVRHFADILGAPAPPTGSVDTLADMDAVVNGLITDEDQQFLAVTSSPQRERPQKRRRTVGKPTIQSSSPVKKQRVDAPQPQEVDMNDSDPQNATKVAEPEQEDGIGELETRALRNSPSKANEQRAVSPSPESTPESVRLREQAGAKAASQLLAKRSSKLTKSTKLSGTGRKAGSKLQNDISANDNKLPSAKKARAKRASEVQASDPPETGAEANEAVDDGDEPEIEETVVETHEDDQDPGPVDDSATPAIAAPHRVFALFKGTYNMFYPALWLGASSGGQHRVRFDDGTVTSVEPHLVSRMELALGDQVKVDWQGMKNKTWIVKGFGPTLPSNKAIEAITDIYGHETVNVQVKSSRYSVSGPNAIAQGEGQILNVAVEVVYLSHSMWSNFASREFQSGADPRPAASLETPSTGVQTPIDTETPRSRSRRATTSTVKALEKRGSFLRDESATAVRTLSAGLFHGMAFAVSFGPVETEKNNVIRLIQRNGGTILDEGFEGLFEAPTLDDQEAANPFKKFVMRSNINAQSGLRLKAEYSDLGFVALIADKHSRRAKYIQALALGIPTLSGRWIVDSLDTEKNSSLARADSAPLAWIKYLLAAGESSYLNGAIRSRDTTAYDAASAKLDNTIANRPLLLGGEGVLIVASKKSKAVWERRKAFAFLTLALGAGHVKRISDLQEAKTLPASEADKWKFVYVDGPVAEASTAMFGKGGAGAGKDKKRKRDDPPAPKADAKALSATDGTVRIVNDEFVIQSLILGALVD